VRHLTFRSDAKWRGKRPALQAKGISHEYKETVFSRTHTSYSPWIIVKANDKKAARLESIRYVLSLIDYEGKDATRVSLYPDPNIVTRFHRGAVKID
jgi:hypothetical protein